MLILVTGGAASGKSEFAERLCMHFPAPYYYIATMQPYGKEGEMRIKRHRELRKGKGFTTIERYVDIGGIELPEKGTALLECIGNLTANEMFRDCNAVNPSDDVISGILRLYEGCKNLVVVSNEVGSDGVEYDESTRGYIDALGRINAEIAKSADAVFEVCAGIPIKLKGDIDL